MSACENCGTECALPFTCDHCGGKFCPDCRLPPNHNCTGLGRWNRKPRPSVSMNYGKGGVSVTGGGYIPDQRNRTTKKPAAGVLYLKIMIIIIALVLIVLAWLSLSGMSAV
ncbi:AN1-type zinc finger domain-containing protein [Methanoregula sp.]|uniref:AN1-type zinc finger domain-containing protein n=1 Tax=Methanoregula sp. TaxID=2052170 RepID=UPI003562768D